MRKIIKKSLLIGLGLITSISVSVFANTIEVSSNDIVKQDHNLVFEQYSKGNVGWTMDQNGKWYYYENGQVKKGWLMESDNWYYLSKVDGSMVRDRVDYINNEFYCFDKSGVMQGNKWYYNYGAWYWLKDSGAAYKGWLKQGNYWYYLDKTNAFMLKGVQNIDGTLYLLTGSGALTHQSGWIKMYDTYYYANSDGSLRTGWVKDNGQWYYLNKNGQMATGWIKDGGYWYYLDPNDGHMYTDMAIVDFNLYFFNSDGQMLSDRWIQYYGEWYYLTSSGTPHKGWISEGSLWYYLDNKYGYMFVGCQLIDEKVYLFTKSGVMSTEKGWIYQDGYYYYGNGDGTVKTGWQTIDGKTYYFIEYGDKAVRIGNMVRGKYVVDGIEYYFDDNGVLQL